MRVLQLSDLRIEELENLVNAFIEHLLELFPIGKSEDTKLQYGIILTL